MCGWIPGFFRKYYGAIEFTNPNVDDTEWNLILEVLNILVTIPFDVLPWKPLMV